VQSRVKALEKIERVTLPPDPKAMRVQFVPCPRSGDQVVVMKDLAKSWPKPGGGVHPVFSGLSGVVRRGDRIALTGVNGAGKSSLLKVIAGQTEPTFGNAAVGPSVRMGYFSQYSSDSLDPGRTIFQEVEAACQGVHRIDQDHLELPVLGDETTKSIRPSAARRARDAAPDVACRSTSSCSRPPTPEHRHRSALELKEFDGTSSCQPRPLFCHRQPDLEIDPASASTRRLHYYLKNGR
jgi:ABC-type glutathione transport system ATPase component